MITVEDVSLNCRYYHFFVFDQISLMFLLQTTDIIMQKLSIKADAATPFDMSHLMFNLSGDIIYRVALSHELGCQEGGSPVLRSLNTLTEIGTSR